MESVRWHLFSDFLDSRSKAFNGWHSAQADGGRITPSRIPVRPIHTIKDVVDWGLCTGCGACYSACSRRGITLVNIENVGIRPRFDSPECSTCTRCLSVCPGYEVDGALAVGGRAKIAEADDGFGSALEIWEGFAADPEIRYSASSGGALSALALYCLEREGMKFVVHTAKDDEKPWQNRTVQSRTRAEILARAGSRYSPASPCDSLQIVEESDGPCVFIGKPCDTAAIFKMRQVRPDLDRNLGLVLAFFCAGTPSSRGTLDLVESLNVDANEIRNLRYRGEGWPGHFKVVYNGDSEKSLSYKESWGALTRYRPLRCHLCPDGLGRVADISCGDAWDKFDENGDTGRSLIVIRTPLGREILRRAIAAGYLQAAPTGPEQVLAAQSNLLARRREIFGRLVALRFLMIPTPKFSNFALAQSWLSLSFGRKMQTLGGTLWRALRRGWWRRRPPFTEQPSAEFHNV